MKRTLNYFCFFCWSMCAIIGMIKVFFWHQPPFLPVAQMCMAIYCILTAVSPIPFVGWSLVTICGVIRMLGGELPFSPLVQWLLAANCIVAALVATVEGE